MEEGEADEEEETVADEDEDGRSRDSGHGSGSSVQKDTNMDEKSGGGVEEGRKQVSGAESGTDGTTSVASDQDGQLSPAGCEDYDNMDGDSDRSSGWEAADSAMLKRGSNRPVEEQSIKMAIGSDNGMVAGAQESHAMDPSIGIVTECMKRKKNMDEVRVSAGFLEAAIYPFLLPIHAVLRRAVAHRQQYCAEENEVARLEWR